MSIVRKHATMLVLLGTLFVGTSALAAPQRDDPAPPDFVSKLRTIVVRVLEDIRVVLPGG